MWRADLVRIRTGLRGARLAITTDGDGQDELNAIPGGKVTIERRHMERIPTEWLDPWRNAVIMSHRYGDTDAWVPIIGGPIVKAPSATPHQVQLQFAGIQEILRHRLLVHEWTNYADIVDWRANGPWWEGSLGQIAWNAVQMAQVKPRGSLPIVHGTPDEYITDDTRQGRGWRNFDIAKNRVWDDVLTGLCEEDGGPDIRFVPEYDAEGHVRWRFEHGTHHDPRIAHPYTLRIDADAAQSPITDLDATVSGVAVAHRVYGAGAGEGAGTEVRVAERLETVTPDMPLMESAVVDNQRTTMEQVVALAEGALAAGGAGTWQIAGRLQTSPAMPLWQVRPGAPAQFRVSGLAPFPSGWVRGRILKVGYDWSSDAVSIEIKEDTA